MDTKENKVKSEVQFQTFHLFLLVVGNYPRKFLLTLIIQKLSQPGSGVVSTLYPYLSGGGVDCTKLSDDNFSLADLEDHTGDWQRVGAYSSWVDARIFEETQPGRKENFP